MKFVFINHLLNHNDKINKNKIYLGLKKIILLAQTNGF